MAKPPKPFSKEALVVGLDVQDGSANVGVVRCVVKWEKKDKPPNGDAGTYCGVEFKVPKTGLFRYDGKWEDTQYFDAPTGTVEFIKANEKKLWPTMNEESVKALRAHYGEKVEHLSDTLLIKFCVARKFEMPKVILMLDKHLKWVEEYKPTCDIFLDPKFGEFYPVGFCDGLDREGNLLYFERPGNAGLYQPSKFVSTFGIEKICQWHITSMEEGRRRLSTHPTATRVTAIIDLTKYGSSDMSVIKFGKAIGAIDQDNYPEHLSRMFIINAPGLFTGVWRMMRVFIDDRTKAKISILGKDYLQVLEQHIEKQYMPDFIPGGLDTSWNRRNGCLGSEDPDKLVEAAAAFDEGSVKTPKESDCPASPQAGGGRCFADESPSQSPTTRSSMPLQPSSPTQQNGGEEKETETKDEKETETKEE